MFIYRPRLILLLGFLLSFLMLMQVTPAAAATFTVDNAGDAGDANTSDGVCDINAAPVNPGDCTLRAAIQQANALSGSDTITISIAGPINIASELVVVSNITINGGGVTVNNTGSGRVFGVALGTLTLSNITVTGGSADNGGGIGVIIGGVNLNSGANVTGNIASGNGGGVYVYFGTLRVNGGTITGNIASGNGGGVYLTAASGLNASGAMIASNTATNGGAIFQESGSTTVSGSAIVCNSDNAITYSGGTTPMNMGSMGGNWWGSVYGPYYSTSTQGLQCSTGDSLNSGNPLANYGINVTTPSPPGCETPPVGNWLTSSPVSGVPPISSVSAISPNRVCPRS